MEPNTLNNYLPEWWYTTDLEVLAEEAIHYSIKFREEGVIVIRPIEELYAGELLRADIHPDLTELMKSIQEYGMMNPIITTEGGEIVDGIMRFRAAQMLELKTIPCTVVSGMKHWHGMCEFLRQHHWGIGVERFLKLGYIPEHEQECMDQALWSGNGFRRGHGIEPANHAQRIYSALRHQNFNELLVVYNDSMASCWNKDQKIALIMDVEDTRGRFDRKKIRSYRTPDVIGLARGFFMNPYAGIQTNMLPDAMMEAGCEDAFLINHVIQNMTRGSVVIHSLIWDDPKDGIVNPGLQMWNGNPRSRSLDILDEE